MKRKIDSKYEIVATGCSRNPDLHGKEEIVIRNIFNGNEIPENEPTFIFRAKDRLSLRVLQFYFTLCETHQCTKEQLESLRGMQAEFAEWQLNNPEKLKQPGSTMPADMKKLKTRDLIGDSDNVQY